MLSGGQRAWVYVTDSVSPGLAAPSLFSKGKGNQDGKGKSKMSSKGKGKGKFASSSKGKGKGKGKFKESKGKRPTKGKAAMLGSSPGLPSFHTQNTAQTNASNIKCHFCHAPGHIKPNCRKLLALSQSERYQQRNSHETKYQLIYDHLEDSFRSRSKALSVLL